MNAVNKIQYFLLLPTELSVNALRKGFFIPCGDIQCMCDLCTASQFLFSKDLQLEKAICYILNNLKQLFLPAGAT